MDIGTLIGLISGVAVIAVAVLFGSDFWIFLNLPGFLIVIGGTFAATLIKFPIATFATALVDGTKAAFIDRGDDSQELIRTAGALAEKVRKAGLLSLENEPIENAFLRRGIKMCVDGNSPQFIHKVLTTDMIQTIRRDEVGERIFRSIGDSAPAFGLIGTLVGLAQMLNKMGDPATVGPAMAVALLTTLYGALIAHLIALPIADKLQTKTLQDRNVRALIIDSVLSIQKGENPRVLDELLEVYVPDNARRRGADEVGGTGGGEP